MGQKERSFFVGEKTLATAQSRAKRGFSNRQGGRQKHFPTHRPAVKRSLVEKIFRPPPIEWIKDRLSKLQDLLQQRTARPAQVLRDIIGPIRLELVTPDIGRTFYKAVMSLDALALTEPPPGSAEGGSNSLRRWRRWESNPRPRSRKRWRLRA
jgi:hypothetical protein